MARRLLETHPSLGEGMWVIEPTGAPVPLVAPEDEGRAPIASVVVPAG
ncbi:MAG: hypothetical protein R3C32_13345 [Chloroflexota bacterium]